MRITTFLVLLFMATANKSHSMTPPRTPNPSAATPRTFAGAKELLALSNHFPLPPKRRYIFETHAVKIDTSNPHVQNKSAALAIFHCVESQSDHTLLQAMTSAEALPNEELEQKFNVFCQRHQLFKLKDNPVDEEIMIDFVVRNLTLKQRASMAIISNTPREFITDPNNKNYFQKLIQRRNIKQQRSPFWVLLYDCNNQNWFCIYFGGPQSCLVFNHTQNNHHSRNNLAIQKLYDYVENIASTGTPS